MAPRTGPIYDASYGRRRIEGGVGQFGRSASSCLLCDMTSCPVGGDALRRDTFSYGDQRRTRPAARADIASSKTHIGRGDRARSAGACADPQRPQPDEAARRVLGSGDRVGAPEAHPGPARIRSVGRREPFFEANKHVPLIAQVWSICHNLRLPDVPQIPDLGKPGNKSSMTIRVVCLFVSLFVCHLSIFYLFIN